MNIMAASLSTSSKEYERYSPGRLVSTHLLCLVPASFMLFFVHICYACIYLCCMVFYSVSLTVSPSACLATDFVRHGTVFLGRQS
jgi:hypothetical protein